MDPTFENNEEDEEDEDHEDEDNVVEYDESDTENYDDEDEDDDEQITNQGELISGTRTPLLDITHKENITKPSTPTNVCFL